MSKMNAVRIINLNYNNNGIRVDDETFHLNGDSTLISLRNGGGKSVLVQMLIAPFVHKRYRDTKNRQFSSYFTTNKPTFILVEWRLDGGAGYVLTGMMVRKSQEVKEEQVGNDLDIIHFIHEYKEPNSYDINHFPVIEAVGDSKKLKNYNSCKLLFENMKNDRNQKFFTYDMNVSNQARNYYEKLGEYQIYFKEWEAIIKKVNLKESGLSELFMDSRDESGLIEKWFLDAIEKKLNKGRNRIEEFRDILSKYLKQYKDSKSKIEQKETILLFKSETQAVLEKAQAFRDALDENNELANKIANLISKLTILRDESIGHKGALEERMDALEMDIEEILYQDYSYQIYQLMDEKEVFESKKRAQEEQLQRLKEEEERLTHKKAILECAKIYAEYTDASNEVQRYENELDKRKKKDEDLAPERDSLGYTLRLYYEKEVKASQENVSKLERKIGENRTRIQSEKVEISNKEKQKDAAIGDRGSLREKIKSYDKLESDFLRRYKDDLNRNIIGHYEEGTLEIKLKDYKATLDNKELELTRLRSKEEENKEKLHSYSRQIEELSQSLGVITNEIRSHQEQIIEYEEQISLRKLQMKYINMDENKVFQTEEILNVFQKKIEELSIKLKEQESEYSELEKEYKKLESGQVLELPTDFKDALDEEGIHYVYGMEWLKKNHKSLDENQTLVKTNPFIPYSLVMTESQLHNLESKSLSVYTSFPIPIIKRENLEVEKQMEQGTIQYSDKVNFYVLFNNNLLNEEQLQKLLDTKRSKMEKVLQLIGSRKEELDLYNDKYNLIKYQTLNEKSYKKSIKNKEEALENKAICEETIEKFRESKKKIEDEQSILSSTITEVHNAINLLKQKIQDFTELMDSYYKYLDQKSDMAKLETQIRQLEESILKSKGFVEELTIHNNEAETARINGNNQLSKYKENYNLFSHYKETSVILKDIEDIKARYEVITKGIALEQQEIENQLEKAREKFGKYETELIRRTEKYQLKEEEYQTVVYDYYIEETLEIDIDQIRKEIDKRNQILGQYRTDIQVQNTKINNVSEILKEKLGREELIPREQITTTEFTRLMKEKKIEKQQIKDQISTVIQKFNSYQVNLSNLAEYDNLEVKEQMDLEENLVGLSNKGLDQFRGIMVRDYKAAQSKVRDKKEDMTQVINEILRNEAFYGDFFKKPLITLLSLINDPIDIMNQLTTTIKSYDDLVIKLEVDIAIIEKEKDKVIDMLLEYIEGVHKNLGEIDKNSTIRIREKSIKMLRINLPDWEHQLSQYELRIREMVDTLTKSGLLRLENNENIDELIGSQITTKNLYHTVVGINNIEIKLYKIEAEREYQISWAEVSKNSGGEGFLSAFVILSSLLSFMRRDETDLFAEYEEGKVLVMDNPFAQTNASHLLKPLMDIANKSNTQLICLSGLGGESIYNRFDNIYVLNLISSNLKKGMQYLKGEHTKGDAPEVEIMVSSQIRTQEMKQMSFLF